METADLSEISLFLPRGTVSHPERQQQCWLQCEPQILHCLIVTSVEDSTGILVLTTSIR